ncbi:MAG: hypothetical protein KatS3mg130_1624 [Candidatus Sumerlaea sp.]|jgi:ubiquinone/menaquinone biosynthesis C-methylase UbiE|uniref:C-27 O-methyltransferase n=1 Tax=Sumerlaea chitinivorans TaxID=2250252 RepID=A0A2Z4Y259_SUMC1|nr:C-27 O-methyltransferase [Candidatus Sumerlaea chitinivorans]GIX45216.1 MAG: hypothetical protein KatS3mg130_1624 [Candidatus Sumerlaea sp.]
MFNITSREIEETLAKLEARNVRLREFGFDALRSVQDVVQAALPLSLPLLEIGTGKGRFLTELARHVEQVVSLDQDAAEQRIAQIQAIARGVARKIHFVRADARHLPFPDQAFGSVISMNTFHHVTDPLQVLQEMVRVVGSNGKIVISDFNEEGFDALARLHRSEGREHPRGNAPLSLLAEFLRVRGWHVERRSGHCQDILVAYGPAGCTM